MKKSVVLLLAAALCGCLPELPQRDPYLVKPPPAPTDLRTVPITFALTMLSARKADSVTMRVFDTGRIKTRGEGVSALKSYHSRVYLNIPVFLIKHSEIGYILFGTGLSPRKDRRKHDLFDLVSPYRFKFRQKKGRDIVSQLKAAGIGADEIRFVILPNLESYTAGMADSFPEAEVIISRREWEWRSSKVKPGDEPGPLDPQTLDNKINKNLVNINNAPSLGAFDNGVDLFDDTSIFLVNLPGRTPGNMGLWVNLDNGPVLLTGGATFVVDNYLDMSLPVKAKMRDLREYWRSLHIIAAMRKAVPQLMVVPGSDLAPLRLMRRPDIQPPEK